MPKPNQFVDALDDSKRLVAKLMSNEDISIQIVKGAPTAYFDVVNRVLSIPDWTGLTLDQYDFLLGHEVGHAKFTDASYIETIVKKENKGLKSYWNVVEDAYIERKMRGSYPGLKRIFYNAYESFTKNGPILKATKDAVDVGGGRTIPIKDLSLIDRINCFYKIGAFCNVPIAPSERHWIEKIDKVTSTQEALKLAMELYQEEKERQRQMQNEADGDETAEGEGQKKQKIRVRKAKPGEQPKPGDRVMRLNADDVEIIDDDGKEGDSEGKGDGDSDKESQNSQSSKDGEKGDAGKEPSDASGKPDDSDGEDSDTSTPPIGGRGTSDPTAITDDAFRQVLEELARNADANDNPDHILLSKLPDTAIAQRTVKVETVLKNAEHAYRGLPEAEQKEFDRAVAAWEERFVPAAKYMAMEFDRRKTARAQERARIARTGRLDMSKLHKYRFADNLFQHAMTLPRGQSHGIVMLLDGSASMDNTISNVFEQLALFAEFAFYARIPFEAYMFSQKGFPAPPTLPLRTLNITTETYLIQLVNTTTDRATFKRQMASILRMRTAFAIKRNRSASNIPHWSNLPYLGLANATPLYQSMMLCERHIARMKRSLKLDKMLFVNLTDGDDCAPLAYQTNTVDANGRISLTDQSTLNHQFIVRDVFTKQNHLVTNNKWGLQNSWLYLFYDVLKRRHECRSIHIFLCDGL